jgi:CxxC-x17-CxxC domain-containing protein
MKKSNREKRSRGAEGGKKFPRTDLGKQKFGSRGDHSRFGDRDSGRNVNMHKAICSECGAKCELPFKPTGDKPVFCSNCFGSRGQSSRPGGRDSVHSHFQEKRMHSAICADCGAQCEVPFRPTAGKPIYCKNCFRKGDSTPGRAPDQFRDQLEMVNAKLDAILKLLKPVLSTTKARAEQVTSKPKVSKLQEVSKPAAKKTASPIKAVKKKAEAKKTVAKKATSKPGVSKAKKAIKPAAKKTASPKKGVKKKAVAKKKVTKKAAKKKKS